MKLRITSLPSVMLSVTLLVTSCSESECDKLYNKFEALAKEGVELEKKVKENPKDAELLAQYLKIAKEIGELQTTNVDCKDDEEFRAKLIVLMQSLKTTKDESPEMIEARKQMEQGAADLKKTVEDMNNVAQQQVEQSAKQTEAQSDNSIYLDNDELMSITGTYKGSFGNTSIEFAIDDCVVDGTTVKGYNIVKGNKRALKGVMTNKINAGEYTFELAEPGDDKYDGVFIFGLKNGVLSGEWQPNNGGAIKTYKLNKVD